MKPKHRIYCRECGRYKLLFETEKKALNFIKFNAQDIINGNKNGFVPKRAYYCECCGGYHVTHCMKNYKPYTTSDIINAYNNRKNRSINN